MATEMCDTCGDIDADWYYDCDKCQSHLCDVCYGDPALTICKNCATEDCDCYDCADKRII